MIIRKWIYWIVIMYMIKIHIIFDKRKKITAEMYRKKNEKE